MICRTCAHSVDNAAMICNYCGLNPLLGVDYCPKCSKKTTEREVLCFKCGSSLVKNGNLAEEYKISAAYKKLYRSEDEKYLFGLIAGISHKFKIPAIYVRVGFIILLLLSGYLFTVFAVSYLFSLYIPELPTKHKIR